MEVFRYLNQDEDHHNSQKMKRIGAFGEALISSLSRSDLRSDSIISKSVSAYRSARQSINKNQTYFLFDIIRHRSNLFDSGDFGDFDERIFDSCVNNLANQRPGEKQIINNRIDALNYTLLSGLSEKRQNHFIYITDSTTFENLHSSVISSHTGQWRSQISVWNTRTAAIYSLIVSACRNLHEARNVAWELYDSLNYETKAIQYEIARKEDFDGALYPSSADEGFQELVFEFQSLQNRIKYAEVTRDELSELMDKRSKKDLLNFNKLSISLRKYIKKKLDLDYNHFYRSVMKVETDTEFSIEKTFNDYSCETYSLKSQNSNRVDFLSSFKNYRQYQVDSDMSVGQALDAMNLLRSNIYKSIIKGKYERLDLKDEGKLLISSGSNIEITEWIDFDWCNFSFGRTQKYRDQNDTEPGDVLRQFVGEYSVMNVVLLRYATKDLDISFEKGKLIVSLRNELWDEIEAVLARSSSLRAKSVLQELKPFLS